MVAVDDLILNLIITGRKAKLEELAAIIAHVSQAPFAAYLSRVPPEVRMQLAQRGIILPGSRVRTIEWHLLKRIYLDEQWPIGTTEVEFVKRCKLKTPWNLIWIDIPIGPLKHSCVATKD